MSCSLRQVVSGLQRLTIASTTLPNAGTSCALIFNRSIQTTSSCLRKLDNRAHPPYKFPSSKNSKWEPLIAFKERYGYTTKHLPFPKTGGRGPNGRIWNHKRGGGHKRNFRMLDWVRGGTESTEPLMEVVDSIQYDPNRSARIALVASGTHKRYVIATQNMKAGDIIKSSLQLTKTTVRANEGDAYPVGSLPVGTLVNSVQRLPDDDGRLATAAGVTAQIVRKMGDMVVIRLPSKHEIGVSQTCQATVGRVSNIDHNKRIIGKAGRNRWLGIRPSSGRWHRKTGRFGRKIRPLPAVKVYNKPAPPRPQVKRFTF